MSDDEVPSRSAESASRRTESVDTTDSMPFSRGVSLYDSIYGFAMTLLIANVDPPPVSAWQSLESLLASGVGTQLLGFALSFIVIAVVWRANVRLTRRLSGTDGPVTALNLLAAALVILIAFTTQGISDPVATEFALPTALYAVNIAAVSLTQTITYQVARARGLEDPQRPDAQNRIETLAALITPVVFLASVPVALFIDANTAKLTWLILIVLNPLSDALVRRRVAKRRR
ncbi:TMEM175 family protein [Microbacterium sp.]|uniref:TMEM175 family protein n=1 Tax=Microbacterium sp. TaxID=51671 RepID=UPI003F98719B